jgi:hypothetical protein
MNYATLRRIAIAYLGLSTLFIVINTVEFFREVLPAATLHIPLHFSNTHNHRTAFGLIFVVIFPPAVLLIAQDKHH